MKSLMWPSAPLMYKGTESVEVAERVRTALIAADEVPTVNCLRVLNHANLVSSPPNDDPPLLNWTAVSRPPGEPEPDASAPQRRFPFASASMTDVPKQPDKDV